MKAGATGFKRKAGEVVYIRVNPKDCLSVLDLMKKTGVSIRDKSFPQMVSLALSSALEAMRMQGIIPAEPDMFQYSNRMKYYAGRGRKSTGSIAQQIQMGSIETATAIASGTHPVQGIEEETPVDMQAKYQGCKSWKSSENMLRILGLPETKKNIRSANVSPLDELEIAL
jgi:hypothetical protein